MIKYHNSNIAISDFMQEMNVQMRDCRSLTLVSLFVAVCKYPEHMFISPMFNIVWFIKDCNTNGQRGCDKNSRQQSMSANIVKLIWLI